MAQRRHIMFVCFFIATVAMSACTRCSRTFQYNAVQRVVENNRAPEYLGHGSAKNIPTSKRQLRGTYDSSPEVEQPLHLTRRMSSSHNRQGLRDLLLRLTADYIASGKRRQRQVIEENLPAVVVAKHRVKYSGDDEQLLSTSSDNERPCSSSVDDPPKPQNVPGQSLPAFNPTGW